MRIRNNEEGMIPIALGLEGEGDHEKRESAGSRSKEGWDADHCGAMGAGGV